MKTITIVSVCYNEEKNIARTIESVLCQTTTEYEYIICDGLSSDRTVEIAKSYQEQFDKKGISYRVYSEKDNGVYDAMNKGINLADGKYIYFLNAGDWLCGENILSHFVDAIHRNSLVAVYYADYYYVDKHRAYLCKCDDARLSEEMSIGHPAMVARMDLMRQVFFDTQYRIAADYNFVLGLKVQGFLFEHLNIVSTYFLAGGISTIAPSERINSELKRIHDAYGISHKDVIVKLNIRRQKFTNAIYHIIPKRLWRFWVEKVKHIMWVEY